MEKPRILYVSSDRDACELMPSLLGGNAWSVQSLHTAREALQAAAEHPFDLYVLGNWWLDDDVRGLELSVELRNLDPSTPVLFYSSNASPGDIDAGLATGAAAYVVKPDVNNILERTIHEILATSLSRSHEARMEALRATVDEIRRHLSESDLAVADHHAVLQSASARLTNAFNLLLKAQAKMTFYNAGGTRSDFERMWPDVLEEALQRAS